MPPRRTKPARPASKADPGKQTRRLPPADKDEGEDDDAPVSAGQGHGKTGVRDDRGKRLLDLVVLLLGARQPVPYREIKAQFRAYKTDNEEAGLRAFERDKADLLELGVPLRYVTPDEDDGVDEAGYVVDLRRYRLPEVHLTPDEVAALVLAGSVARAAPGTTYAEVVDLALKKLAFDAPPAPDAPGAPVARREPVVVHYPHQIGAEELPERLAEIEQAIRFRKRITVDYTTSSTGEVKRREIDPYGLVYRQGIWVLVGFDNTERKKVLSFRLDRFGANMTVAAKPKSPDFERPPGFDVRSYALRSPWTFEQEPAIEAELEIHPSAAALAEEDFGPGARKEPLADGGTLVRFACTNPEFVVGKVLEHKGALVVRSPESLRTRVRDELAALRGRYGA